MKKSKITVLGNRVTSKPRNQYEYGKIKNGKWDQKSCTIEEVIKFHCIDKLPISPGVFNGVMSNDNWVSTQVLMLDFDGGISIDKVKSKFKEFGIDITFIYTTLSSTNENVRFRVGLFLDQVVENSDIANFLIKGLHKVFSEADQNCKDLARFFLPGTIVGDVNYNNVSLSLLIEFILINLVSIDGNQTRKFAENHQLLLNYIRSGGNSALSNLFPDTTRKNIECDQQNLIKNFNYDLCKERVKIFNDFCSGEWLYYHELKGLATNMLLVSGGLKFMKKIMDHYNKVGKTKYGSNQFNLLKMVNYYDYSPMYLVNFSKYKEDHEYSNLISAERNKRGYVDVIEPRELISKEDFDFLFDLKFNEVLNREDKKIYIIESPTGSGKTEKILNNITNPVIAAPYHSLLDEFEERIKSNEYTRVPSVPNFTSSSINKRIKNFFDIGLNSHARKLIKEIAANKINEFSAEDSHTAAKFLSDLKNARNSSSQILTTHTDAFMHEYPHDTLIFDEDPFFEIIKQKKVKISDINYLLTKEDAKYQLGRVSSMLNNALPGNHYRPSFNLVEKSIIIGLVDKYGSSSNLIDFFNSDGFIKDKLNPNIIHFYKIQRLPDDKKIIILSASPQCFIYEKLFGERVEIISFPEVKGVGYICQHTNKSYSRRSLKSSKANEIKSLLKSENFITFKDEKARIGDVPYEIHYGMTTGIDLLKGQDLTVIGTPHFNPICYELIACAIGHQIGVDNKITEQRVIRKGLRYMFPTFEDEVLREIQISLIESELIQAVGRARTLRTKATVHLYSNLPLTIANKIEY